MFDLKALIVATCFISMNPKAVLRRPFLAVDDEFIVPPQAINQSPPRYRPGRPSRAACSVMPGAGASSITFYRPRKESLARTDGHRSLPSPKTCHLDIRAADILSISHRVPKGPVSPPRARPPSGGPLLGRCCPAISAKSAAALEPDATFPPPPPTASSAPKLSCRSAAHIALTAQVSGTTGTPACPSGLGLSFSPSADFRIRRRGDKHQPSSLTHPQPRFHTKTHNR